MIPSVVCKVRDQELLVEALAIHTIEPVTKISPVLKMPSYIRGLMDCRGTLLTMIDLEYVLFGTAMELESVTRALIIHWQGKSYGLMVSEACDFMEIEEEQIAEPDPLVPYFKIFTILPPPPPEVYAGFTGEEADEAENTEEIARTEESEEAPAAAEPATLEPIPTDRRYVVLDGLMSYLAGLEK